MHEQGTKTLQVRVATVNDNGVDTVKHCTHTTTTTNVHDGGRLRVDAIDIAIDNEITVGIAVDDNVTVGTHAHLCSY